MRIAVRKSGTNSVAGLFVKLGGATRSCIDTTFVGREAVLFRTCGRWRLREQNPGSAGVGSDQTARAEVGDVMRMVTISPRC
jgi:hypothetical protein